MQTLVQVRERSGLSVVALSQKAGLSTVYMYNVLRGVDVPSLSTLNAVLDAAGISRNTLEGRIETSTIYEDWLNSKLAKERGRPAASTPVTDVMNALDFTHSVRAERGVTGEESARESTVLEPPATPS